MAHRSQSRSQSHGLEKLNNNSTPFNNNSTYTFALRVSLDLRKSAMSCSNEAILAPIAVRSFNIVCRRDSILDISSSLNSKHFRNSFRSCTRERICKETDNTSTVSCMKMQQSMYSQHGYQCISRRALTHMIVMWDEKLEAVLQRIQGLLEIYGCGCQLEILELYFIATLVLIIFTQIIMNVIVPRFFMFS